METELEKWLKYLQRIESLVEKQGELTDYQKEDIKFTKNMISKLEKELNEQNEKDRKK